MLCAWFVFNYRYMGLIVSVQMTHILIFLQKLSKENIMHAQEFKGFYLFLNSEIERF